MADTLYSRKLRQATVLPVLLAACADEPTLPPLATREIAGVTCPDHSSNRVLVDAAHGGGAWWFPQHAVYTAADFHQGQAFAEYLRGHGYEVTELDRDMPALTRLMDYPIVLRVGTYGAYTQEELRAYRTWLDCDVTSLLLGEFLRPGQTDALAAQLGLVFEGLTTDIVTEFAPHALTDGVDEILYAGGSTLKDFDPDRTSILGRLTDGSPVMGVLAHPTARIFFTGDVNGLLLLPQPFTDNLVAWLPSFDP